MYLCLRTLRPSWFRTCSCFYGRKLTTTPNKEQILKKDEQKIVQLKRSLIKLYCGSCRYAHQHVWVINPSFIFSSSVFVEWFCVLVITLVAVEWTLDCENAGSSKMVCSPFEGNFSSSLPSCCSCRVCVLLLLLVGAVHTRHQWTIAQAQAVEACWQQVKCDTISVRDTCAAAALQLPQLHHK